MTERSPSVALLGMSVAAPVAVGALLGGLVHVLDPAAGALLLVLVIVVVSLRGSWLADLIAVVASATSFDFFLTAPARSLKIHNLADIQVTVALLLVGAVIGGVSAWARGRDSVASVRDEYLAEASQASSGDLSRERVAEQIAEVIGADAGVWKDGRPAAGDAVVEAPDRLEFAGETSDPARHGLPTNVFVCFPAGSGHVRVSAASRATRPDSDQMRTACLLAAQLDRRETRSARGS